MEQLTQQELEQLAQLLVKYHNSLNEQNQGIYGLSMERALVHDTFGTLFRHFHNFGRLTEIQNSFRK